MVATDTKQKTPLIFPHVDPRYKTKCVRWKVVRYFQRVQLDDNVAWCEVLDDNLQAIELSEDIFLRVEEMNEGGGRGWWLPQYAPISQEVERTIGPDALVKNSISKELQGGPNVDWD